MICYFFFTFLYEHNLVTKGKNSTMYALSKLGMDLKEDGFPETFTYHVFRNFVLKNNRDSALVKMLREKYIMTYFIYDLEKEAEDGVEQEYEEESEMGE